MSLLIPSHAHPVQLLAAYLTTSNYPHGDWTTLSLGVRIALDLGLHRKKTYNSMPASEQELWRRAFWFVFPSATAMSLY